MTDDQEATDSESASPGAASPRAEPVFEPEERRQLNEKLLRALADAENARKRADNARGEGRVAGIAEVTSALVPALDSLSLAIDAARRDPGSGDALTRLLEGLDATNRAFLNVLAKFGVERIEPDKGEPFDPNVHEAVSTAVDPSVASGSISAVVQSGYRTAARLIRPARVVISS